jgi:hypothetical protein
VRACVHEGAIEVYAEKRRAGFALPARFDIDAIEDALGEFDAHLMAGQRNGFGGN